MQESLLMSLKDASDYLFVTPQALSYAYRVKKIPVFKKDKHPFFLKSDLDAYEKNKWSRDHFFTQKYMSVKEAANALSTHVNKIYYMLGTGRIEYQRRGAMYLIDRVKFTQKYLHP